MRRRPWTPLVIMRLPVQSQNPYQSPIAVSDGYRRSTIGRIVRASMCASALFVVLSCTGLLNALHIAPWVASWKPEETSIVGELLAPLVQFYCSYWWLVALGLPVIGFAYCLKRSDRERPTPATRNVAFGDRPTADE